MIFTSLKEFAVKGAALLAKGPVALIFVEDPLEIASTVTHHLKLGFREIIVFLPEAIAIPPEVDAVAHWVRYDTYAPGAVTTAVNSAIAVAAPSVWLFYCFNAEYLFYPFCRARSVGEMTAFLLEERRDSVLTFVIDLYAPDLERHPNAVSMEEAQLDRSGYYALGRYDPATGQTKDRQLDFFGGLRWRFEEHVPYARRKIDRVGLFRTQAGLMLRDDHTFNFEEYNTYACPWHHSPTATIASFRTAKALKSNPGSKYEIQNFTWHNSVKFEWRPQQLMDLGLMEPGQWF